VQEPSQKGREGNLFSREGQKTVSAPRPQLWEFSKGSLKTVSKRRGRSEEGGRVQPTLIVQKKKGVEGKCRRFPDPRKRGPEKEREIT